MPCPEPSAGLWKSAVTAMAEDELNEAGVLAKSDAAASGVVPEKLAA